MALRPAPAARLAPTAWLIIAAVAMVLIVGACAIAVRYGPLTATGRAFVEAQLNGVKVGRFGRLKIEGVRGDPWGRFTVRRLTISDGAGIWLDARDLAVRWRSAELLRRRVHATSITARTIVLMRRPVLSPAEPRNPLPVSIIVDKAAGRVVSMPSFSYQRGVYDLGAAFDIERLGAARGAIVANSALHAGDFLRAKFDVRGTRAFAIDARARESAGGAMAGALGLATGQPFLLDAQANGSLSAGRFTVLARDGASVPLSASGTWSGAGGSAQGRVQLAASTLLAGYQRVLGPEARFALAGRKAADGFYALALEAESQNAEVRLHGEGDVGRRTTGPGGVSVEARLNDASKVLSWPKMGAARIKAGLGADAGRWVVVGAASVEHPQGQDFSLARLSGPIRLEAKKGEIAMTASAIGEGGAGRGLIAAMLGARPRGDAQVSWLSGGRVLVRKLDIAGPGLKASATGNLGLFGGLSFKGTASVTNLAAARAGAGGQVLARWAARQDAGGKPWTFSFDARGAHFTSGMGELDRLLGAAPRLTAHATYDRGLIAISDSTLSGAAGALGAVGAIGPDGGLKLKLDWRAQGPFALGPLEIAGTASGAGTLTGPLTSPRADLAADFSAIDLPYLPLKGAHVVLSLIGGPGGPNGRISLAAATDYGPAKGAAAYQFAPAALDLSDVAVNAAGVTANGAISLRQDQPSSADLEFAAGPGALLSRGRASGRLKIADAAGGPRATLTVGVTDAVLAQGTVALTSARISADGPLARLPFAATANGVAASGPWRLAGSGLLSDAPGGRLITFSGDGRMRGVDVRTVSPAQIRFDHGGLDAQLRLALGGGRADIDVSQAHGAMSAKAQLSNLNLSLVNADFIGRFDATLNLAGQGATLRGDMDARLTGAGGRDLKGSPPVDGQIRADLATDVLRVSASLNNAQGFRAQSDVTLPAEASAAPFRIAINRTRAIQGRFFVDGELKPVWDLLMGGDRSLAGHLVASGNLAGTLADPRSVGSASLEKGSFQDAETGLKLTGLTLRADLADNAIAVRRFSAGDGARGQLTGEGQISLLRNGVSSLRLDLKAFRLLDNEVAQATASGQVTVSRAADGRAKLAGALAIDRAQIAPNPPIPSGVIPMEVVEVNRPLDLDERQPLAQGAAPVALDVAFKAPGGIFVRGRGLNVELSLDAHVSGTTADPILGGVARVVRGDYDFAGKRFELDDRGAVYLASSAEAIRLDLTATREDPTLTAVIRIQGTAAKPRISLTSSPVLPTDEVLSQVLFGASTAQLPALEAAQLASALSALAGGGGFDIMGGLQKFARLDRLAIGGDATTGATISGGKYLKDNVYVELTGGGRGGSSAQVEWRVRKHLSIVSSLGRQGDTSLSVRWRKDY
jgi:translocation and assembly module TamB